MKDFKTIDFRVRANSLDADLREVVKIIRPDWNIDLVRWKALSGGKVNGVFHCWVEGKKDEEKIIIRVYMLNMEKNEVMNGGIDMDNFLDREYEIKVMQLADEAGDLIAPFYGRFQNGVVYGYSKGDVMNEKLIWDEKVWPRLAVKVAKFHSLKVDGFKKGQQEPLWFLPLAQEMWSNRKDMLEQEATINPKYREILDLIGDMEGQAEFIKKFIPNSSCRVVFCHNDFNQKNMIYDPKSGSLNFIDFDTASYGYQANDIGYLFMMSCGHLASYNTAAFPSKELQLRWIRTYLQKWYELKDISAINADDELENMCLLINQFVVANHFAMGVMLAGLALGQNNNKVSFAEDEDDPEEMTDVSIIHLCEYHRMAKIFLK